MLFALLLDVGVSPIVVGALVLVLVALVSSASASVIVAVVNISSLGNFL